LQAASAGIEGETGDGADDLFAGHAVFQRLLQNTVLPAISARCGAMSPKVLRAFVGSTVIVCCSVLGVSAGAAAALWR
jgi:hypothetical protein